MVALASIGIPAVAVSSSAVAATGRPERGGSITTAGSGEPVNLDVARIASGGPTQAAYIIYDSLLSIDPVTQKPIMRLAESLSSNAAATVWTLKLRPGVVFSDGTAFDAAAVVANWNRHKNVALASVCYSQANSLGSFVAQNATTVVITLPDPRVAVPNALAGCLGWIASPTAINKYGADYGSSPESVVGAGPFVLNSWLKGIEQVYIRNTKYWDKPRPYLDSITTKAIIDPSQRLSAFETGQVDVVGGLSSRDDIARVKASGATYFGTVEAGGGADVAFNQATPGLDDVRIRRALVLATDPQDLNEKVSGGTATPLDTFFVKGSPQYNPKVRQVTNDLKQAQKLVNEYTAQHGPVDLTFTAVDSLTLWATAQAQQWNRLSGLTVKLDIIPAAQGAKRLSVGDWQMAVTAIRGSDPETLYNQMFSAASGNVIHYNNPSVDAALTQLRREPDPEKQFQLYTIITKAFLDDAAVVYWYRYASGGWYRKGLTGMSSFGPLVDYSKLWLVGK